jgi:hypothetical protein
VLNKIWLGIAAFVALVGLSMLGRSGRQLKRAEDRETGYLIEGTDKALKRAAIQNKKANTHKQAAKEAATATRQVLEGINDKSTTDIISRWTRP